jgi:hypothetical protein
MLTGILVTAIVLPALLLGHMAHEEILSQRAYRRARVHARVVHRASCSSVYQDGFSG